MQIAGEGKLWLTVDDLIVEDSAANREAYVTNAQILEKVHYLKADKRPYTVEELTDRLQGFISDRRYCAFFEDNIGEFPRPCNDREELSRQGYLAFLTLTQLPSWSP